MVVGQRYNRQRAAFLSLFASLLVSACAATPTPLPSAESILQHSAQAMQGLTSVHFTIERSGAPAYLDQNNTLIFRRAEGDFIAPDQTRATVRVIGPAVIAEIGVVALGEQYWETDPLTGQWNSYPGLGYNPAELFDPASGLTALLQQQLDALTLVGVESVEDLPGSNYFHLTAQTSGDFLFKLSAGLIGHGRITLDWWITPESYWIARMRVTEPETDAADPTTWLIDLDSFNEPGPAIKAPVP